MPCGVWEAVYLIDSLLQNQSTARPEQVHANTQGQSFPVFGLAHVLGIDLLPRIRNFQDLTFHRPDPNVRYRHIDPLFSTDPRTAVDWELIRRHWPDLMQVALSVRQGTVSSVTLLRRLNNRSRKNQVYQAFREVGRAVRTVVLLRYLSDPALREQIQRATNKAEAYNGFTKWLHFGNAGWLASRDPELQDKAVKFLDLLASSVIFSTTIDMTRALRRMAREGWTLNESDLAVLSPYRRENVLRFGDYTTDQLHIPHPSTTPCSTPLPTPDPEASGVTANAQEPPSGGTAMIAATDPKRRQYRSGVRRCPAADRRTESTPTAARSTVAARSAGRRLASDQGRHVATWPHINPVRRCWCRPI